MQPRWVAGHCGAFLVGAFEVCSTTSVQLQHVKQNTGSVSSMVVHRTTEQCVLCKQGSCDSSPAAGTDQGALQLRVLRRFGCCKLATCFCHVPKPLHQVDKHCSHETCAGWALDMQVALPCMKNFALL